MDIPALISATASSLTFVKDALKLSLDHRIETGSRERVQAALEKLGDLQDSLFQVREELFRLQIENDRLRAELKAKDEWASQKAPYALTQTAGGAVVYSFSGNPRHFACPACYAKATIQILQDLRSATGMYECSTCKATYPIDPRKNLSIGGPRRARSSLSDF